MYKAGLLVFIFAVLALSSLAEAQSCGDKACQSTEQSLVVGNQVSVQDSQGRMRTVVLVDVLNDDTVSITVDGNQLQLVTGQSTDVGGLGILLQTISFNMQNPSLSAAVLRVGENVLVCQQDCKNTGRINTGQPFPAALDSKTVCDSNNCYTIYRDSIFTGSLYVSVFDLNTNTFSIKDEILSQTGFIKQKEFDIALGDGEAFVVWNAETFNAYRIFGASVNPNGMNYVAPKSLCPDPGCLVDTENSGMVSYGHSLSSIKSKPRVTFHSDSKWYLVSWQECFGSCADTDIIGSSVYRGADYPDGFLLDTTGKSEDFDLVYLPQTRSFLGVWHEGGDLKSGAWNSTLFPTTFNFGPPASGYLSAGTQSILDPLISFGSGNILTSFSQGTSNIDAVSLLLTFITRVVPGTNLPPTITQVQSGSPLTVFSSTSNVDIPRAIAFNPNKNEYVIVGDINSNPTQVFLVRVNTQGNLVGAKTMIRLRSPDIQWVASIGKYVLSVEDLSNAVVKTYVLFLDENLEVSYLQPGGVVIPPATQNTFVAPTDPTTASYNMWITDILSPTTSSQLRNNDKKQPGVYFILFNSTANGGGRALFSATFNNTVEDFRGLKIEASPIATAIDDRSLDPNTAAKFALIIPSTTIDLDILVCPNATALSAVTPGCANQVIFRKVNHTMQNTTVNGIPVGVQFSQDNTSYLVFAPGTGAMILSVGSSLVIDHEKNKKVNEQVLFTGNYTDNFGTAIQNSTCNITFKVLPAGASSKGPFNMTFNTTSLVYAYNVSFNQSFQQSEYEITCAHPNYPNKTASKFFEILSATADPSPVVSLSNPANSATVADTRRPSLSCSATDDKNLTSIDLYTDFSGTWALTDTKTLAASSGSLSYQPPQNLSDKAYKWACAATDSIQQKTFSENRTFTIAFDETVGLPACTVNDWAPGPWSNAFDQCGSRTVTLQNQRCRDPNAAKPADSKACPTKPPCAESDYRWSGFGNCVNGNQTNIGLKKADANCDGDETKEVKRTCESAGGFPWLIVIVVIVAAIGGLVFFFLHRRSKPADEEYEEETLWEKGEEEPEEGGEEK